MVGEPWWWQAVLRPPMSPDGKLPLAILLLVVASRNRAFLGWGTASQTLQIIKGSNLTSSQLHQPAAGIVKMKKEPAYIFKSDCHKSARLDSPLSCSTTPFRITL